MKSRCRSATPSWCHNSESPELPERTGKEEGPRLTVLRSALTAFLWALWHWMTLPRRWRGGGKVADREERCLSEHRSSLRLSLLSHLPNHCRDLSWIFLRLDPEQVCLRGPCVCVSPKCFSLLALLLTASISASLPLWHWQRGKKEWDSHHTDSHSAKSKQPCQKNVKSLPFTHHGYWRGRINWGWDSPYSSSS